MILANSVFEWWLCCVKIFNATQYVSSICSTEVPCGSFKSTYALNYKCGSISHFLINQYSYVVIQTTTIFFFYTLYCITLFQTVGVKKGCHIFFLLLSFTLLAFSHNLLNALCARDCYLVQHCNIKIEIIHQLQQKLILESVLLPLYMHEVGRLFRHSSAFSCWWHSDFFLCYLLSFLTLKWGFGFIWLYPWSLIQKRFLSFLNLKFTKIFR